jgi:hypothetical protein
LFASKKIGALLRGHTFDVVMAVVTGIGVLLNQLAACSKFRRSDTPEDGW